MNDLMTFVLMVVLVMAVLFAAEVFTPTLIELWEAVRA